MYIILFWYRITIYQSRSPQSRRNQNIMNKVQLSNSSRLTVLAKASEHAVFY